MVKICPICKQQFPTKAALASHMSTVHASRTSVPRARRQATSQATTMLARRELWQGTGSTVAVFTCEIFPGKSGLPTLDALAQIYEDFKIVSWNVQVKPTVGTNTDGYYTVGVSYGPSGRPNSGSGIAALSPATSNPCYVSTSLSVNPRKIMGSNWLPTYDRAMAKNSPGAIVVSTTKELLIWVSYKVLLNGPTAVKRAAFDDLYEYDSKSNRWTNEHGQVVTAMSYDEPVNVLMDVGASSTTVFEGTIRMIEGAFDGLVRVHSIFNRIIGTTHWISNLFSATLPLLTVPVILHVQRRPFRAIVGRLLELGYRITEEEDPGPRADSPREGSADRSAETNEPGPSGHQ